MMKFCPECGTKRDEFRFCPNCGFRYPANTNDLQAEQDAPDTPTSKSTTTSNSSSIPIIPMPHTSGSSEQASSLAASQSLVPVSARLNENKPPSRTATNLLVSQQGDGDFRTISDAIRAAGPGDRITVRRGIYEESLHVYKPVKIMAEEGTPRDQVIVATVGHAGLWVKCQGVKVQGLSFICRRVTASELEVEKSKFLTIDEEVDTTHFQKLETPMVRQTTIRNGVEVTIGLPGEWRYGREQRGAAYFGATALIDSFCSVTLEDCCFICQGEQWGSITDTELDITVIAVWESASLEARNCLIQGGEFGITKSEHRRDVMHEDSLITLEDCQILKFRSEGVSVQGRLKMMRCKVNSAETTYRAEEGGGIRFGILEYGDGSRAPQGQGQTEEVVVTLEDCEVYDCGDWGIRLSFLYNAQSATASWRSDDGKKAILKRCHVTGHAEGGISNQGGVLEMENCVVTDNGVKSPKNDFLVSAGVKKLGGRLILKRCRINRNGSAVKVPVGEPSSLGPDGSIVRIEAEDCDLLSNDLGSWSVPQTSTILSVRVRENKNKAVQVLRFFGVTKH